MSSLGHRRFDNLEHIFCGVFRKTLYFNILTDKSYSFKVFTIELLLFVFVCNAFIDSLW